MNKKGFTLIELIGVIALLSIIVSIATYSLTRYLIQGREKSFQLLVNSMEDATLEAYTACLANQNSSEFCKNHELPENLDDFDKITLAELLDGHFIEDVKNPWKTSEKCDKNSYVLAFRDDTTNISFKYQTCLICGSHTSEGCSK